MSEPRDDDRRNDKGSVMVIAALAMVALVLFAALAVDVGFMWSSRTQSQNVGDSAAIAAAQTMIVPDPAKPPGLMFDQAGGTAAGIEYASDNSTVANPSVTLLDTDFTYGNWNLDTRTLEPGDPANPNSMTGVRVNVRMDGTDNSRSPGLLSRILQKSDGSRPFAQGFDVNNTAVAYKGFRGFFNPGEFNLPVAIDSCKLTSGGGCGTDFCTKTQPACPLINAQSDTAPLMCGEFSATTTQNMCWTAFDGSSPSITKKKLTTIVDNGNAGDVKAGDPVFMDNGDKTSTVDYIRDKFYGCGSFSKQVTPHDPDYGPGTIANSWVVKLPVVECQDAAHCAGGDTFKIVGGLCFEIREIVAPAPGKKCLGPTGATGERTIKGRPLCPESTNAKVRQLYKDHCQIPDEPTDPGGCGFGLRASRVVLVE